MTLESLLAYHVLDRTVGGELVQRSLYPDQIRFGDYYVGLYGIFVF